MKHIQDWYRTFIIVLAVVFIAGFAIVKSGIAQNASSSQTLEISPPSQEVKVDPGNTVKIKAKVRNRTNATVSITARIEDFTASGDGGQVALIEKGPYAISSWTVLDQPTFSLKTGETKEVTATATVPAGLAGGRYGSFVFSVGGAAGEGTAAVSQEVASLFLLRISGPVSEVLTADEFKVPSFVEFGPVPLSLKFSNKGNVHVRPNGLINVRNMFGKTTADVVFKGENVFPGASRSQEVLLDKTWLFGPYTAQAVLTYGSKNESLTITSTFFAFPLRLAVVIGVIIGVLYMMRRRLKKALKALIG